MVFFKRKPVQFIPDPPSLRDDDEVWSIEATNEVFVSYSQYIERIEFLREKVFMCEITGHTNLTFWEALQSENNEMRGLDMSFPEALKEPVLRKVQFSVVPRIDHLVDQIFEAFKTTYFPGETLNCVFTYPHPQKFQVLVRSKTVLGAMRLADGTIRPQTTNYSVERLDVPGPSSTSASSDRDIVVDESMLSRERSTFTKTMLRTFVKHAVTREAWYGAPWLVKPIFAERYKIDQSMPTHLRKPNLADGGGVGPGTTATTTTQVVRVGRGRKGMGVDGLLDDGGVESGTGTPKTEGADKNPFAAPKVKEAVEVIKYPIEDLDLPSPGTVAAARPKLNRETTVSSQNVEALLETWTFLNVFSEPLLIDSFTLDDWVEALKYDNADVPCEIIDEVHCALLKVLVEPKSSQCVVPLPKDLAVDGEGVEGEGKDGENGSQAMEVDSQSQAKTENGEAEDAEMENSDVKEEDEEQEESVQVQRTHLAEDMLEEEGSSWRVRLQRRDFRSGGWELILVGFLHELTLSSRHVDTCTEILEHLCPMDRKPVAETAKEQYYTLKPDLKLMIFQYLMELILQTPLVRKYIDECMEDMTTKRKEKVEFQRERKIHMEKLASVRNSLKEKFPQIKAADLEVEFAIELNGEEGVEGEDGDNETVGTRSMVNGDGGSPESSPVKGRKRSRTAMESDDTAPSTPAPSAALPAPIAQLDKASQKDFTKLQKALEAAMKDIKRCEDEITTLNYDLAEADCQRLRLLGKDRFHNRYWWCELNGMPHRGMPDSSTYAGYATGRIWVQGPARSDLDAHHLLMKKYMYFDPRTGDPKKGEEIREEAGKAFGERKQKEEGETCMEGPLDWGYYDTPEQVGQLLQWLKEKGVRELKLRNAIIARKSDIIDGMRSREHYLSQAIIDHPPPETRRSARGKEYDGPPEHWRVLKWKNLAAMDHLGHLHSKHKTRAEKAGKVPATRRRN
ncbi:hypothetical protein YB2330_001470 [Saitoella coloradoensis]